MNRRDMMTCDEFKELAPAYALIALDEDERRACAQHLATVAPHRGCVEAVEQAALVAAHLGTALSPSLPPPHVWQNIAAQVRTHRAGGAVATMASAATLEEARRRGIYHICGWLLAAALLGLYLYASPFDMRRRQSSTPGAEPATAMRGATAASAQLVARPQ